MYRRSRAQAPATGAVAMVLGTFTHEGLTAKLEALGFSLVNRNLRSTPRNWDSIVAQVKGLIDEDRLPVVFIYLSSPALLHVAGEEYDSVREELLTQLERTKTLAFVYEDALVGVIKPFPWEVDYPESGAVDDGDGAAYPDWRSQYGYGGLSRDEWLIRNKPGIDRAMSMLSTWAVRKVDLLPFRTRSDVTIRIYEALDDAQSGVFLRLYVPHGRYQSQQFEDFLGLFARYLREAEGREFSIDVERTSHGTAYVFKGRGEASSLDDIRDATQRFDEFLNLARRDRHVAEEQLVLAGAPRTDAGYIIDTYLRSTNRLILDSKHEFERRHLALVQEMESTLLEIDDSLLIPTVDREAPSSLFSIVGNTAPVTINVGPGMLARGGVVLAAETILSGDVAYSAEDREILARIAGLEDALRIVQLRSDLDQLKDPGTAPDVRRTAVQRLKGFLYESGRYVGKKVDEVGTKLLIAYLEAQIKAGG